MHMNLTIEHEREDDGRWLAEMPELPGVLAYGTTADEAMLKAEVLALRIAKRGQAAVHLPRDHECMTSWPSSEARQVLSALCRIGWTLKRQTGSHKTLSRSDWPDVIFAFHDEEEICPRMLVRIAKRTGLTPDDL